VSVLLGHSWCAQRPRLPLILPASGRSNHSPAVLTSIIAVVLSGYTQTFCVGLQIPHKVLLADLYPCDYFTSVPEYMVGVQLPHPVTLLLLYRGGAVLLPARPLVTAAMRSSSCSHNSRYRSAGTVPRVRVRRLHSHRTYVRGARGPHRCRPTCPDL
jgi:hypothetical protein